MMIFMEWLALLKDKIFLNRLTNIIYNRIKPQLECLRAFSEKEHQLQKIEMQFDVEKKLRLKNKIMFNWVLLVEKRESLAKFQARRQIRILNQTLQCLKCNWLKNQAKMVE